MSQRHKLLALAAFLLLTFAAAALGSLATARSVTTWMPTLNLPSFQPPSWLFGPVWTLLYTMMAVAAWLVYVRTGRAWSPAMLLFAAQLTLNALWSVLFFGLRRPDLAAAEIVLLLALIVATAIAFWRHSVLAGALMVPYALWVCFATVLNVAIWRMNP